MSVIGCGSGLGRCLPIRRVVFVIRAVVGIRRGLPGGDLVCAVHGHAVAGGALPGVGVAQRGDLPAPLGGVVGAWLVAGGARCVAGTARGCGPAGLVTGDRGCLVGGGEKGGAKVARTLTGKRGSRFHLAVDAAGLPLEVRLAAGNENERRHLLPLIDALQSAGSVRASCGQTAATTPPSSNASSASAESSRGSASPAVPANRSRQAHPPARSGAARNADSRPQTHKPASAGHRTHQRLDPQPTPNRDPPRPQTRNLRSLPPTHDDPDPHPLILRPLPDPESCQDGRGGHVSVLPKWSRRPSLDRCARVSSEGRCLWTDWC